HRDARDRHPLGHHGLGDCPWTEPQRHPWLVPDRHSIGIAARRTADRTMTRQRETGSSTVEAVIGLPAFILFVGLIVFGGRTATAPDAVRPAAAAAARSASIARTGDQARPDARAAARASLTNQQIDCTHITVEVNTSGFGKQVGEPGTVDVTVTCRLD